MSDWDTVTILRKRAPKASTMKTESAVNQARRQGAQVDTSQKCLFFFVSYPIKFERETKYELIVNVC